MPPSPRSYLPLTQDRRPKGQQPTLPPRQLVSACCHLMRSASAPVGSAYPSEHLLGLVAPLSAVPPCGITEAGASSISHSDKT